MDSAVVQPPPAAQPNGVGQTPRRGDDWLGWACLTLVAVVIRLHGLLRGRGLRRTRHRPRDQRYEVIAYSFLLLLLGLDPSAAAVNRLDLVPIRFAVWSVLLSLVYGFASRVAKATPVLVTKLLVSPRWSL
jgi:hypothetical protein